MTTTNTVSDLLAKGAVTIAGATQEYGLGRSRLYLWMQAGELPYSLVGAKRLIPRVALERIVAAGMVGLEFAK